MPDNAIKKERPNLLVVEDSPTQAEKLKFILEENGYDVRWEENAAAALDTLLRRKFTLVISDVLMPEMDGYEFCSAIKQDDKSSRIPVMLLTSLSEPQDIIRGLECGADNFIIKPYKKNYLLSQVEYMLANAKLREIAAKSHSEIPDMGIEIYFAGKKHYIMSSQLQILDLLFSTFEVYAQKNKELEEKNRELADKYERIKALNGIIPICANCKKIRDDHGYWQQVDEFLALHSDAGFNRSLCPDCSIGQN
jgi:two-component system cell cycle response regulator